MVVEKVITKETFKKQWHEHIAGLSRIGLSDGCTPEQYNRILAIQKELDEIVATVAKADRTMPSQQEVDAINEGT